MLTNLITSNPFAGKPVAVLGDVMVDLFIYGEVERISPEAPIPVVKVSKKETHLGGASNVAANLKTLGATPIIIGRIGDDDYGTIFKKELEKSEISSETMLTSSIPTISKCRVIARTQQVVRVDEEETDPLTKDEKKRIQSILENARKKTNIIIVSDYAKGLLDEDVMKMVRTLWADGHILVDPKPKTRELDEKYHGATMIKPNLSEAVKMSEYLNSPREDALVEDMAAKLMSRYDLEYSLITRSGDGMTLTLKDGSAHHLKSETQEIIDVSGAGDTVIATFAAAISAGFTPLQAAHFANVAGGVIVSKLGTASITFDELKEATEAYEKLPYVKEALK